jgi:putative SOS response-associated peptidase YedK
LARRATAPAWGFLENVGTKYPKTQQRFTLTGGPFLVIAGLWREAEGNHPVSFIMLATSPGADIAPYHDRHMVVLRPADWAAWLYLTKPQAELLRPLRRDRSTSRWWARPSNEPASGPR